MRYFTLNYIIFMLFILSCEKVVLDNPDIEDTVPPTVNITFPANQSILNGIVKISVYAHDNSAIEKVMIYLNDSIVYDNTSQTFQLNTLIYDLYEYEWDTHLYNEDEFYNIRATVKDSAGNYNQAIPIQVKIDNEDNIKPSGLFLSPSTGQILNGNIEIVMHAEDNDSIDFLTLFIDGDSITTFDGNPETGLYYHYFWNTLEVEEDNIHTLHAHIADISGNSDIIGPINVTVNNQDAPDILTPQGTIIYPPAGSILSGIIDIEINAYDNIAVDYVEFIIDGIITATDSAQPYIFSWNTIDASEDEDHTININIYDEAGNMTSLYPITVYINNLPDPDITPPTIFIYDPASNQTVLGEVSILAIAIDNDNINRVEFYHNYSLVSTMNDTPFTHLWNTLQETDNSQHVWYAKAFDNSENEAQTIPMTLFVNNIDDIPPYGAIINPYAGQTVYDIVTIQVSAEDNIGISLVEFYIDGVLQNTDFDEPYSYVWDTNDAIEDQEHVIAIIIADLDSNTYHHSIVVNVDNHPYSEDDNTPPFASILTPVSGQIVSDTVFVSGFAIDNYSISEVRFYINDELVSTLNDTPYNYLWNTFVVDDSTEHIIQMITEDQAGNTSHAQPVLITVDNSD